MRIFPGIFLLVLLTTLADAEERTAPEFPPPGKIRVVIDTDAANEIDDQYAIALALVSPERFQSEVFVGANFGDSGGEHGAERSFSEIQTVLEKALMAGYPVKLGSDPLRYSSVPENSEGVDFIIERAMDRSRPGPLWGGWPRRCDRHCVGIPQGAEDMRSAFATRHGRSRPRASSTSETLRRSLSLRWRSGKK